MTYRVQRWQVVSTVGICLLAIVSALLALLQPGHYPPDLLPQYLVQDAFVILVGLPALVVGLAYARVGSHRGQVVWLGALGYMTYIWASIGLQVPFNRFFLGYVLAFGLSLFTLIGGMARIDPAEIQAVTAPRISERTYGGFLWIIGIGLAVLWLSELVPATLSGTPPLLVEESGPQALASHFIDLATVVPSLAIAGTMLWRRRSWGYVFAGVGLVFGAILAPTITGMTLAILLSGSLTVPTVAIVFSILPGAMAALLALKFLDSMSPSGTDHEWSQPIRPA